MSSNATTMSATINKKSSIADIRIVREYPHPRRKVWRALTEPDLVRRWLMRPEGFEARVGCRFKLVARPQPGWRGFVECEVLEIEPETRLRYSWVGKAGQAPMEVTFDLEDAPNGTRLVFTHSGFTGVGGFFLSKLMLGPGWKKMFGKLVPKLLAHLDDDGSLTTDDMPHKF